MPVHACACASPGSTCLNTVSGMANQVTGDLPGGIQILDDCTAGSPNCDSLLDEGAGIGELMFDVAPDADFMFHTRSIKRRPRSWQAMFFEEIHPLAGS